MSPRLVYFITVLIGSTIGGYLPILWGGSAFSMSSVILSAVGGILGIVVGYKLLSR